MKILCGKCHKQLTSDLYPVKAKYNEYNRITNLKQIFDGRLINEGDEYIGGDVNNTWWEFTSVKKGIFYQTGNTPKHNWTHIDVGGEDEPKGYFKVYPRELSMLVVGEKSILAGVIPPFREGAGCCNWAGGYPLKCECNTVVGEMHLDCYEDGNVRFIEKKVRRCYK